MGSILFPTFSLQNNTLIGPPVCVLPLINLSGTATDLSRTCQVILLFPWWTSQRTRVLPRCLTGKQSSTRFNSQSKAKRMWI